MRRASWTGWALCFLCASSAVCAQDYPEDDVMILDLIREDGTQPETGAEPAAEFLKCNKVKEKRKEKRIRRVQSASFQSEVVISIQKNY